MREFKRKEKKSQLVFDMKYARKLLKMNGEVKFCPYCGKSITEKCDCHKNIVIDVKPLRGSTEASIAVFDNNDAFQRDYSDLLEEARLQREAESEQSAFDFAD